MCHLTFPADQTVRYGTVNVCAGCKPKFMQGLREGATVVAGNYELATIGSRFGEIPSGVPRFHVPSFQPGLILTLLFRPTGLFVPTPK